jgi:hypothetical protein
MRTHQAASSAEMYATPGGRPFAGDHAVADDAQCEGRGVSTGDLRKFDLGWFEDDG